MQRHEDDNMILGIERTWSDDAGLGVWGWVVSKVGPLDRVDLEVQGQTVPITSWHPRPDVAAAYPQYQPADCCGFWVQAPRRAEHQLTFKGTGPQTTCSAVLAFQAEETPPPVGFPDGSGTWGRFIRLVNENRLSVLEIGSRVVSPGSRSKRELFPQAASYTGFDYHPDANTDMVGDAHRLSSYFPGRRFGAIFSLVVLEHVAMPWLLAREISKLLESDGLTFHSTVAAWPLHARPWDFWRFSDDGLKVLFSPFLGFETLEAGLYDPVSLHFHPPMPGCEAGPIFPAFAGASLLARKTHDCDGNRCDWDASLDEVLGPGAAYPTDPS